MNDGNSWIESLLSQKDGLFEKLASDKEGWHIKFDGMNADVPLNELDLFAYNVLLKAIQKKQRIAIALPRVKVGVSLSIIAYLTVNRFLTQSNRNLSKFVPLPLVNGHPVIIATKNRQLRDFFLESGLTFNSIDFPFTQFPLFRLNRLGGIISLTNKTESLGQIKMDPVIFYHFDKIEIIPEILNSGYVLGELTETDSLELTNKFCSFINTVKAETSLMLVNEFASDTISILKQNGFKIIALTNKEKISDYSKVSTSNLPSLGSSLAQFPKRIWLKVNLIDEEEINSKLTTIHKELVSVNKKLGNDKPNIVLKAWSIYYALKDLSVPLNRLEEFRKSDAWLKSIKYNLEQIFNFPVDKLEEKHHLVIAPIWGTLGSEYKDLYDLLSKNSPKYNRLIEIVTKLEKSEQKWHIVFNSQIQFSVFREELLINTNWVEGESNLSIGYINDFITASEICEKIILVGSWKRSDQSKILSLFPNLIYLVCYGNELSSMSNALYSINNTTYTDLANTTFSSLHDIGINVQKKVLDNDSAWISADEESQILLKHYKEEKSNSEEMVSPFDSGDWSTFGVEEDISEEIESTIELVDSVSNDDETLSSYEVILDNGRHIFIPLEQEIFAYSDNNELVESKLPEALDIGDIILIYSEEQGTEMFQNVLKRTQELSKVDTRVITLWKTALKELREWYDIKNPYSLNAYMRDLKENGCTKLPQTVKQWLKGITLAPRDQEDIECLLIMAKFKNARVLSKIIQREMESVRVFHRILGKRLRERLEGLLKAGSPRQSTDPIDREIDEMLEMAEPVSIKEIIKEVKYIPKAEVRINIFG